MLLQVNVNICHSYCSYMHLTKILMTRLPHAVFLSVLLFASHAKKPDNKSDPASNENVEAAGFDKLLTNVFDKWFNKMWIYPYIWILGWGQGDNFWGICKL